VRLASVVRQIEGREGVVAGSVWVWEGRLEEEGGAVALAGEKGATNIMSGAAGVGRDRFRFRVYCVSFFLFQNCPPLVCVVETSIYR